MTKDIISIIIYCGVSLLFFILQVVIKKRPVSNELDKVLKNLYSLLPCIIFDAEKTGLNGPEKMKYAVEKSISFLKEHVKMSDSELNEYRDLIVNHIELILSTPRKKVI